MAPDKFKGSLTAAEAAQHIAAGLRRARPGLAIRKVPVADGGEGTVDAVVACGFERRHEVVSGPLGRPVTAAWARRDDTGVIELAQAAGQSRLPEGAVDAMRSTSRGVGELVMAAVDDGCRRIVLGLGGSASTDGGAGMLQALGARVLDAQGRDVPPGGAGLPAVASVDLTGLPLRLRGVQLTIAHDVDNPLLGQRGASAVFAPQKGASPAEVAELESGLRHWASVLTAAAGRDEADAEGAGAAGGVGFAALAALSASSKSGAELLLTLIGFDGLLEGADVVFTGEGRLDQQSLAGKAPVAVARVAAARRTPSVAVVGRLELSETEVRRAGFSAAYPLTLVEPDVERSRSHAGQLIEALVARHVAPLWAPT